METERHRQMRHPSDEDENSNEDDPIHNEDEEGRMRSMHAHQQHHPGVHAHPQHHPGHSHLQDIGMEDGGGGGGDGGGMEEMDMSQYRGGPPHDAMMHGRPIPEHMMHGQFPRVQSLDRASIVHNVLPPAENVVTAQQVQALPHGYTIHDHQQRAQQPHPMHHHAHPGIEIQHHSPHPQAGWSDVSAQHHHMSAAPYIPQDQPPSPPDSDTSVNPVKETKKRKRQMKTPEQLAILEKEFAISPLPNKETRYRISSIISLTPRQVQIWFQNKRAKVKNAARKRNPNFSFQNSGGGQQAPPPQHHQQMAQHPQHYPHAPAGYPPQQGYQFQHYQQYDPQHYQPPPPQHQHYAHAPMPHMMDQGGHPHPGHGAPHPGMGSPQGGPDMNMACLPVPERKKRGKRGGKKSGEFMDDGQGGMYGNRGGDEDEEEEDDEGRVVELGEDDQLARKMYLQQQRRGAEDQQQLADQPPKADGEGDVKEKSAGRARRARGGGRKARGSNGAAAAQAKEEGDEEEEDDGGAGGGGGRDFPKDVDAELEAMPSAKDDVDASRYQVDKLLGKTKDAVVVRR